MAKATTARRRPRTTAAIVAVAVLVVIGGVLVWGSVIGTSQDADPSRYEWCADPHPKIYFDSIPEGTTAVRVDRRWFHVTTYSAVKHSGLKTPLVRADYSDGGPNCAG